MLELLSAVVGDAPPHSIYGLSEWRMAYDAPQYRGVGSTFRRAKTIHGIYDTAAPLPDAVMPPPSKEFLSDIRRLVISAIEASGGHVRLLTA
jgi:hypothetical protein